MATKNMIIQNLWDTAKAVLREKFITIQSHLKKQEKGFPGGAVVKNLPANAGDTGLISDPGRSHMPWSN